MKFKRVWWLESNSGFSGASVSVKPPTESVFDGNIVREKKLERAEKDLFFKINCNHPYH